MPCSPLSDVWGFESQNNSYAVVGAVNGISIVDVSNPRQPSLVSFPYVGCITEWRDMKTYGNYLYVVTDQTSLCTCSEEQQPCQQLLVTSIEQGNQTVTVNYTAATGKAQKPLSAFENGVEGLLVIANGDSLGCSALDIDLTDKIAMIDAGNCSFTEKTLIAQNAGASGIVIVGSDNYTIYPSMSGNNTGIEIPGLLISQEDGFRIRSLIDQGLNVTAYLNENYKKYSDLYLGPDGWYILDVSDITDGEVTIATRTNEFFNFAHNLFVDPDRPLIYVCGHDSDVGGVLVFDLTVPDDPQLIANFSLVYIHDMDVVKRGSKYVLYGCAIYDDQIYVIDVSDPWNNSNLNNFVISVTNTTSSPHNAAQTEDGQYLYVTHEGFSYQVTVWNCSDLSDLQYISEFSVNSEFGTSPHNALINGNELWMSYYSEGILLYDIASSPGNPEFVDSYDTSSYTSGFHGVWGIYPYTPGGNTVYGSDIESGLWVLGVNFSSNNDTQPSPSLSPSLSPSPSPSPSSNNGTTGEPSNTTDNDSWILYLIIAILGILVLLAIIGGVAYFLYNKYRHNRAVQQVDGNVGDQDFI